MKKKQLYRGIATALVTPFRNGEIDYEAFGGIIEYQISKGVDALVVGGTTGEISCISDAERQRLYSFAIEKVNHRVPLIVGCGSNNTRLAADKVRMAELLGADGALVVTPYYNKGTDSGILKHYYHIADSSNLPIIIYNVPGRTGVNISIRNLEILAECENIVGIKEASDSAERFADISALGEELVLYSGNDSLLYLTLALGGGGVVSVCSNIFPDKMREIVSAFDRGDWKNARELHKKLLPFIDTLFAETNPAPIKYIMWHEGFIANELRLPLDHVARKYEKIILEEYEKAKNGE